MSTNKLFIKNLPLQLSKSERNEFFSLFGGTVTTNFEGKLKHCCLVTFPDHISTKQALEALHQTEILDKRLTVEYSKEFHEKEANRINASAVLKKSLLKNQNEKEPDRDKKINDDDVELSGVCPSLGVFHDFPTHLKYKYPEPSVTILTNIANAMACIPKFYIQVLHLMNKLNLPPPFSVVTPSPPMKDNTVEMCDACVDTSDLDFFSDESEIEYSDNETLNKQKLYQSVQQDQNLAPKRKRLKVMAQKDQEKLSINKSTIKEGKEVSVDSAFDLSASNRRFEFKLGASIKEAVEGRNKSVSYNVFDERGSFGKIQPQNASVKVDEFNNIAASTSSLQESSEDEEDPDLDEGPDFITLNELKQNQCSLEEILAMPQFKKYNCGEVSNRLYVKNLAKQVTDENLKYIFGRFAQKSVNTEEFNIRLMQEGRMKGQAFITFPTEKHAKRALKYIHGYILHAKPIIIQYAKVKN